MAIPSPRKPSAEGEKALEAWSDASLARELKGSGASGVVEEVEALEAFFDDDEAVAEGAGRRKVAGRTNGMVFRREREGDRSCCFGKKKEGRRRRKR